jgi:hypothetical protein
VPTNADALAVFPWLHPIAYGIHNSNDLVSRHTRILNTRLESFLDQRITVTNTARVDLNPDPSGLRLRNISFNQF